MKTPSMKETKIYFEKVRSIKERVYKFNENSNKKHKEYETDEWIYSMLKSLKNLYTALFACEGHYR